MGYPILRQIQVCNHSAACKAPERAHKNTCRRCGNTCFYLSHIQGNSGTFFWVSTSSPTSTTTKRPILAMIRVIQAFGDNPGQLLANRHLRGSNIFFLLFWRSPPCQVMDPSSPQSHRQLVRDQVAKPHTNQRRGLPHIGPSSCSKCCTYRLYDCMYSNLAESFHNLLYREIHEIKLFYAIWG